VRRRLLWIAIGLSLVGAGLYTLGRDGRRHGGDAPPMDHIDAASRRQLERVLLEAERSGGGESR
jgi:hypothetical protein